MIGTLGPELAGVAMGVRVVSNQRSIEGRGRALLLPGQDYGPERPLLHYAHRCLAESGRDVRVVHWATDNPTPDEVRRTVAEAAGDQHCSGRDAARLFIVAKSMGAHAIPWAAEHGVPGIWLTPVLDDEAIMSALPRLPSGSLLIGGTADPYWDGATATSSGLPVLQIEDADHSLEIPGDVQRSIAALSAVSSVIAEVLAELSQVPWPDLTVRSAGLR